MCGILLGDVSGSGIRDGLDIEYVILSSCRGKFAPSLPVFHKVEGLQTYYNILWVQREGDLMYRKGISRVIKDMWDDYIVDSA
jgi:hypothetical protein